MTWGSEFLTDVAVARDRDPDIAKRTPILDKEASCSRSQVSRVRGESMVNPSRFKCA